MLYLIISPAAVTPSERFGSDGSVESRSIICVVLTTLIEASEVMVVTVGSFEGSVSASGPSVAASPSSDTSLTSSVFPGLEAVAVTVFVSLPLSASVSVTV